MSVQQYPKNTFYIVVTGNPQLLGSYSLPADGDLVLSNIRVYNKRTGPYTYTLKLEVSATPYGQPLVSSDVITFSNSTTGQTTSDWLGDVTFTFPNYALKATEDYYFRLVTAGYTRIARPLENTGYLAVNCDWLEPIGTSNVGGARMQIGVNK